mgnify:CR=1 FL=1
MFYIQRHNNGAILSVAQQADDLHKEAIAPDSPELASFLASVPKTDSAIGELQSSDASFIRVLEDVIDLLIDKDLLQFTELPEAAQQKLLSRRQIRERLISSLSTSSTLLDEGSEQDSLI